MCAGLFLPLTVSSKEVPFGTVEGKKGLSVMYGFGVAKFFFMTIIAAIEDEAVIQKMDPNNWKLPCYVQCFRLCSLPRHPDVGPMIAASFFW